VLTARNLQKSYSVKRDKQNETWFFIAKLLQIGGLAGLFGGGGRALL
jgi:hypothetical protein